MHVYFFIYIKNFVKQQNLKIELRMPGIVVYI